MPKCNAPCRLTFLIRDLRHGGAQRQVVTLACALAARGGFLVTVIHFYPGVFEAELQCAGIQTHCVGKKHRWDLAGFFIRLVKTMRQLQPDVIHSYLHESNLMALLLKPLCRFPRVVWGIRDSQTDADTWGLLGKLSFRLTCLLSRWADVIIANSRAGRTYYISKGYPADHFQVVPNGIDTERFHGPPHSNAASQTVVFTHIGRLHPMKDHATLFRAAALVPGAKLHLIGNGDPDYVSTLKALAVSLSLSDRLTWSCARDDLPALYPTLDCVVSTSAYGEGFSNVLGEAMACGIPCIASDVGDSAWLVDDARWTFPAGDHAVLAEKMRAFISLSTEEKQALGQKNRQRIEQHFTVEKMVARTSDLCLRHQPSTSNHQPSALWLTTGLGTGGAEMMLTQLITGLPNHRHIVISLTSGGKYIEPLRAAGAEVHTLDMPAGRPTPRALWRLFKIVRQTKPGIIMGWMYHGCLAAQLTRLVHRAPVIWNIRQSLYDLSLEKRGSALVIRTLAQLSSLPHTITYNSQVSAQQHEGIGYSAHKTRLIPNGFDLEKWQPVERVFQLVPSPQNELENSFYIGRFGRFTAMKDYPTFLEAAALIIKEATQTQFLLVGTSVDATNPELTALVTKLGLTKNVHLLGECYDLPALTASLTLAVSSSAFGEGFPNVVGEAMACGVPVVATDIGDTAWVMGDTGRLVPAKNPAALAKACLEILTMIPDQRTTLGQAGRQRISDHFSLTSVLTQFDTLLSAPITHR